MPARRFPCLIIGFALLAAVFLGSGVGAAGATGLGFGQPLAAMSGQQRPGPATAPVSASGLAAALRQHTGLAPSQVTEKNACPDATPGHVTCDARVLVLKSTQAPVHPTAHKANSPAQLAMSAGAPPGDRVYRARDRDRTATATATGSATEPSAAPAPQAHTPAYLQQAYDLTWLSAQNGASDTVAIVDAGDDATAESDLATFRSNFGLPACTTANGCFRKVNQTGTTSPMPAPVPGWEVEISLDLDAVSSLCPNCHILLVEANTTQWSDMQQAVQRADSMGANQISMSFSGPAASDPGGPWAFPNVSSLAATGDHGYPGPGVNDYPAAEAGVTAVGGTSLTTAGNARGYAESAWSLSGPDSNGDLWGGGSGCDLTQPKPSYQPGSGCAGRAYSDVSADGDGNTGLDVYDGGWLLVGGTSLATPLTAAYEAVTGIADPTPQWAYTNSAELNDITSGFTGSCDSSILYVCNAQTGYDGPTGEGSISGELSAGGPGIGGSYTTSVQLGAATLNGGVYANRLDTTYRWEWGTTTSYGSQTAAVDAGAGGALSPISTLLPNLQPNTTYHYRLLATNADGTTYGYDNAFTTPSPPSPPPVTPPSVSAAAPPAAPPTVVSAATLAGRPVLGGRISLSGGLYANGTLDSVEFYRCAQQCTPVGGSRDGSYTPTKADEGQYLRAQAQITGPGGTVTAWSANVLGPVTGPSASALTLAGVSRATRSHGTLVRAAGHTLVTLRTSRAGRSIKLVLTAAPQKTGVVTVRVYVLRNGAIVSCTAARVLRGTWQLTVRLSGGQTVQVAAVKRAHG